MCCVLLAAIRPLIRGLRFDIADVLGPNFHTPRQQAEVMIFSERRRFPFMVVLNDLVRVENQRVAQISVRSPFDSYETKLGKYYHSGFPGLFGPLSFETGVECHFGLFV